MCGISGFSMTKEHTALVGREKFKALAQTMAEANLHRGGDAYGWVAQFPRKVGIGDGNTIWFKSPKDGTTTADDLQEKLYDQFQVEDISPTTFALHTRAKSSSFSELDGDNNHPVQWGKMLVTHNGMVRNHAQIKSRLRLQEITDVPTLKVDSLAIPALLSQIQDKNPRESFEEIGEIISEIEGGFAFTAQWILKPEYLLLATGPEYPLTVWINDGYIVYASESKCLNECATVLDDFKFPGKQYKFEPGTYMLLYRGKIVKFGTYDCEREKLDWLMPEKPKTPSFLTHRRWLPATKEWYTTSRDVLGVTGTHGAYYSSVDMTCEDRPRLLYSIENGMGDPGIRDEIMIAPKNANTNIQPPEWRQGESFYVMADWKDMYLKLCEADRIYIMKKPGSVGGFTPDYILYAFFGDVEMVFSDAGTLHSIINWGKWGLERPVYETADEYRKATAKQDDSYEQQVAAAWAAWEPVTVYTNMDEWLKDNTLKDVDDRLPLEKVVGGSKSSGWYETNGFEVTGKVQGSHQSWPKTTQMSTSNTDGFNGWEPSSYQTSKDCNLWMQTLFLEKEDRDKVIKHESKLVDIPFLWNEKCPIHMEEFIKHSQPLNCPEIMAATTVYMSWLGDIESWQTAFNGITINENGTYSNCKHLWTPFNWDIHATWGLNYVEWVEAEMCELCQGRRYITGWPMIARRASSWLNQDLVLDLEKPHPNYKKSAPIEKEKVNS